MNDKNDLKIISKNKIINVVKAEGNFETPGKQCPNTQLDIIENKPKHDYRKQGKKNRAAGKRFEIKVREDLEDKGWLVFRNSNDVEDTMFPEAKIRKDKISGNEFPRLEFTGKSIKIFKQAKSKWNPYTKVPMTLQSGFPDFVCIKRPMDESKSEVNFYNAPMNSYILDHKIFNNFSVVFVECKCNGTLSKEEKEKCEWIKSNLKIDTFIASKIKKGRNVEVQYEQWK